METNFTPEQIKSMELEFKEFLEDKDNILHKYHTAINNIFSILPKQGMLAYSTEDTKTRGELVGSDGKTFYTWWTSEDILGFAIVATGYGMFANPQAHQRNSLMILAGIDLREKFIDIVNISIEVIQEVSEQWDICIT